MTSLHARNGLVTLALLLAVPLLASLCEVSLAQAALSLALGAGIQALNLVVLDLGVQGLVGAARSGARPLVGALVVLRLVALALAVGFALFALPVEPLLLALGLSSAVPAAIWHGLAQPALPRLPSGGAS